MTDGVKYIDLLTDYGFKRVFGDKELLIPFLNALFEKEGKVIKSVRYMDKEITPLTKEERTIFYDLLCKVEGGSDIIIEMQHKSQETFRERALYYMARAIDGQGDGKKKWNYKTYPVYGLFITNFHLKELNLPDAPVSEYVITNKETHEQFTDKFRMIFIDLLSFRKDDEDELDTNLDKWVYSIKNMGTLKSAPKFAANGVFERLYTAAELAAMTKRQRNQYEASLRIYRDMLADKETTRIRVKRAHAEGLEEGRVEREQELIAKMRGQGYTEEQINSLLGE